MFVNVRDDVEVSKEGDCPQCKRPLLESPEVKKIPRFCLHCRLPQFVVEGRYRLLRKIGEGGMGQVYLAQHTQRTGQPLRVLKFLPNDSPQQYMAYKRFVQEVNLTVELSQKTPHIVKAYNDFGYVKDVGTFYVMEYVKGDELSHWLSCQEKPMELSKVCSVFRQLLSAVKVMHNAGVIHRDLKPQNIMIETKKGSSPFLKLADFGAARQLTGERLTKSVSTMIGTPLYMAPEQFVSSRTDEKADIYALGLILYELLTGRHPFSLSLDGATNRMMKAASAHLYHEPPPFSSFCPENTYPKELELLVMQALHKDPQQRIESVESFDRIMASFVSTAPDFAPDSSPGLVSAHSAIFFSEVINQTPAQNVHSGSFEQLSAIKPLLSSQESKSDAELSDSYARDRAGGVDTRELVSCRVDEPGSVESLDTGEGLLVQEKLTTQELSLRKGKFHWLLPIFVLFGLLVGTGLLIYR